MQIQIFINIENFKNHWCWSCTQEETLHPNIAHFLLLYAITNEKTVKFIRRQLRQSFFTHLNVTIILVNIPYLVHIPCLCCSLTRCGNGQSIGSTVSDAIVRRVACSSLLQLGVADLAISVVLLKQSIIDPTNNGSIYPPKGCWP